MGVERFYILPPIHQFWGQNLAVKIYPRLVHVIKSFNSQLQGGQKKTMLR